MCADARNDPAPVFACNLNAISAADRPRYHELAKRVRSAMRDRSEKLDSNTITWHEAAEWISMERLCCPFLALQISASGNQPH